MQAFLSLFYCCCCCYGSLDSLIQYIILDFLALGLKSNVTEEMLIIHNMINIR
jgi:hypothetical protein